MDNPQSSFYSFLKEPMLDLEPGFAEGHDSLARFNVELEQSIAQHLGSAYANTQDPKGTAAKDENELNHSNVRPVKRTAVRTKISLYQKLELEYAFHRNPYPTKAARAHLAYSLGLGNQTLVNWFKKRRYRWRRQPPNSGEPVPFPYFVPESQVQILSQHPAHKDVYPCCFQETLPRHQESQQLPFY